MDHQYNQIQQQAVQEKISAAANIHYGAVTNGIAPKFPEVSELVRQMEEAKFKRIDLRQVLINTLQQHSFDELLLLQDAVTEVLNDRNAVPASDYKTRY